MCCQLWHMVQIHGHWPYKHRTNLRPHRPKWKEVCSTSRTRIERPTSGSGRGKSYRYNRQCEKMKLSWAGHINRLKDDRWTSSVTTRRPYDKKRWQVDQPSDGETTWTNTGATQSGTGQHKTGSLGDGMPRPSPDHGPLRLPNDDYDDHRVSISWQFFGM